MNQAPNENWLWTVVVVQGDREDLYNFQDPASRDQVTPAFKDKDTAERFWARLKPLPPGQGIVQAIRREELAAAARRNGLTAVIYDPEGRKLAALD
jgi:hypothetical protein